MSKTLFVVGFAVIALALACSESKQAPIKLPERQVDVSQMNRAAEFASRLLLGWNDGVYEVLSPRSATQKIIDILSVGKQKELFEESIYPLCGRFVSLLYFETLARGEERIYCFRGVFQNEAVQPEILVTMDKSNLVSDMVIRLPK